jgi:Glycosyltransferase 61
LESSLPPNFSLVYLDPETDPWIQPERFVWASMISGLCMGVLPQDYYDAIRGPVFKRLGLPATHVKTERLYISRRNAGHRRVRNEDALVDLLAEYGFRSVQLEKLSFEEQVALFHRAEIVVGPHGAGLGTIFFSGDIDLVALYSTTKPGNYFHSLACGLGQRHHFLCSNEAHEDDWLEADVPAVRRLLESELGLTPTREAP